MKETTHSSMKAAAITHKLRKVEICPKLIKPIIILLKLFRRTGDTAVVCILGVLIKEADDASGTEKLVQFV